MFKPYFGVCICHGKNRLIIVKKGYCKIGNDERKGINRKGNDRKGLSSTMGDSQGKRISRHDYKGWPDRFKNAMEANTSLDATKVKKGIKKKAKLKYVRRATGEGQVFAEIFEESLQANEQEGISCRCCSAPLGSQAFTWMFSHVLAKGTFPAFRLWKRNIWLCCHSCHDIWDQGSRSSDNFAAKRKLAATLKKFYYWLTHKNRMTSDPDELEILFKEFENEY